MDDPALVALAQSPGALVAAFVLGTLWGSFANVCIYRWPPTPEHPDGRSVVKPGSHCGACGKPVRWYDNVPILSWLWLRGRCRDCGTTFSARYLLVEAFTGVLFAATWWFAVDARGYLEPLDLRLVRFAIGAAFSFVMVVVIFIDLDHRLILDRVTLPSLALFYGLGLLLPERHWTEGIVGAAVGFAVVRLTIDLYFLVRGRIGMGEGDAKLLAVVGALLGWKAPLVCLFLGAGLGVLVTIPVLLVRRAGAAVSSAKAAPAPLPADDTAAADDDDDEAPWTAPWAMRRVALASLVVVTAALGLVLVGAPPWVGGLVVVVAALADDRLRLTERALLAADPDPPADDEGDEPDGGEPVGLGQVELPFGPFLALAALFWWYAEPYVMFELRRR